MGGVVLVVGVEEIWIVVCIGQLCWIGIGVDYYGFVGEGGRGYGQQDVGIDEVVQDIDFFVFDEVVCVLFGGVGVELVVDYDDFGGYVVEFVVQYFYGQYEVFVFIYVGCIGWVVQGGQEIYFYYIGCLYGQVCVCCYCYYYCICYFSELIYVWIFFQIFWFEFGVKLEVQWCVKFGFYCKFGLEKLFMQVGF